MPSFLTRKLIVGSVASFLLLAFLGFFFNGLRPVSADAAAPPIVFEVKQGDGFRKIIGGLRDAGVIRSSLVTETFSLLNGSAVAMQPGRYKLSPTMSAPGILEELTGGSGKEVAVTIPEGTNLYQIDTLLNNALVIKSGELINFQSDGSLEGKLFPDTYRFFTGSDAKDVAQKFLDNFNVKAAALLQEDLANANEDLILASVVEKEVPDAEDQKIVAGILWKRLKAGMPLQVDATVCYAKFKEGPVPAVPCYPFTPLDFKIDSPYNTYLYKGLPPSPIGNPGISAISAAIHPKSSPYWFYLSDPKTGKTIFAKTLDEQTQNKVKYLKGD